MEQGVKFVKYKKGRGHGDFYATEDIGALRVRDKDIIKTRTTQIKEPYGFAREYKIGDAVLVNYGTGSKYKYSGEYEGTVISVGPRVLHVFFPESNTQCGVSFKQQHLVKKVKKKLPAGKISKKRATAASLKK